MSTESYVSKYSAKVEFVGRFVGNKKKNKVILQVALSCSKRLVESTKRVVPVNDRSVKLG